MRKLLIVISALFNLILFVNIHNNYKEDEISQIYGGFGFFDNRFSLSYDFSNEVNNMDKNVFYEVFDECVDRFDVDIKKSDYSYEENRYYYYLYSNLSIKNEMNLLTDQDITFRKDESNYYDSKNNLYLLNEKYDLRICPLHLTTALGGTYSIYGDNQEKVEEAGKYIEESFAGLILARYSTHRHEFDLQSALSENLRVLLPLTAASLLLVLLSILSNSLKKISIHKLNGFGDLSIALRIIGSDLIYAILAFVVTFALCYLFFVTEINPITIPIIKELIKSLILELFIIAAITGICTFIVSFLSLNQLLKGLKFRRLLLNFNAIIKVLILIIIVPLLNDSIEEIKPSAKWLFYEVEKGDYLSEMLYVPGYIDGYRFDGYDPAKYYTDKNDPVYLHYSSVYDKAVDIGGIYCGRSVLYPSLEKIYNCLDINSNFLKTQSIRDMNDKVIEQIDENYIYILIPNSYAFDEKAIEKNVLTEGEESRIIYIQDNQDFVDYSVISGLEPLENPILIVHGNNTEWYNKSIFSSVYFDKTTSSDNLNTLLQEINYDQIVEIKDAKQMVDIVRGKQINIMKEPVLLVILSLAVLLGQMYEFVILYKENDKERTYCKEILGYGYWAINASLFLEDFSYYLFVGLLCRSMKYSRIILLIFFIYELIIIYLNTKKRRIIYERN